MSEPLELGERITVSIRPTISLTFYTLQRSVREVVVLRRELMSWIVLTQELQ